MDDYLTPEETAKALKISRSSLTRCKQAGAPVHYFGPAGKKYRFKLAELIEWMDAQGQKDPAERKRQASVLELRAERHRKYGKQAGA